MQVRKLELDDISMIKSALKEDKAKSDLTSEYFIEENDTSIANIVSRENVVVSGLEMAYGVFGEMDSFLKIELFCKNGDVLKKNDKLMQIRGSSSSILSGERSALNFLQYLSGIATVTKLYVEKVKNINDGKTKILDTRKTLPMYRKLSKYAVVHGGGVNHRHDLNEAVMVKDNHLTCEDKYDSLKLNVLNFKKNYPDKKIEVEVDNLNQLKIYKKIDEIDIFLLDNMSLSDMSEAVKMCNGNFLLEASGGITLEKISDVAKTGVDFISVGALTHSVRSVDLSLEFVKE